MTCHACNDTGIITTYVCDNPDFPELVPISEPCPTCNPED